MLEARLSKLATEIREILDHAAAPVSRIRAEMWFGSSSDPHTLELLYDTAVVRSMLEYNIQPAGFHPDILPRIDAVRLRLMSCANPPTTHAKRFHYTIAHLLLTVAMLQRLVFSSLSHNSMFQQSM